MGKRINSRPSDGRADEIEVQAVAGFKHRGLFIRTGEVVRVTRDDANDLRALNMARIVNREPTDG
jgi:hypothetical protein